MSGKQSERERESARKIKREGAWVLSPGLSLALNLPCPILHSSTHKLTSCMHSIYLPTLPESHQLNATLLYKNSRPWIKKKTAATKDVWQVEIVKPE